MNEKDVSKADILKMAKNIQARVTYPYFYIRVLYQLDF